MPNSALPVTLAGVSSRAIGCPISVNWSGVLISGSTFSSMSAASAASAPKPRLRPLAGVHDHAVPYRTAVGRHVPAPGRRLDQAPARAGAGLLQEFARTTDGTAAAGAHALIEAVLADMPVGRGVLGPDLAPVAAQLLGHDHRQRGQDTLAHLRLGHADQHAVVRLDDQPGIDLGPVRRCDLVPWLGRQHGGPGGTRDHHPDGHAAGRGERGGEEMAPLEAHDPFPHAFISAAARWIAARRRG